MIPALIMTEQVRYGVKNVFSCADLFDEELMNEKTRRMRYPGELLEYRLALDPPRHFCTCIATQVPSRNISLLPFQTHWKSVKNQDRLFVQTRDAVHRLCCHSV